MLAPEDGWGLECGFHTVGRQQVDALGL